jgi:hypothetical protein
VAQKKPQEPGLDLAAPEAFLTDFDAVLKIHKEKEASNFNDDTEYKACLNEVQAFALPFFATTFSPCRILGSNRPSAGAGKEAADPEQIDSHFDIQVVPLASAYPFVHTHHPPSLSQPRNPESRINSC